MSGNGNHRHGGDQIGELLAERGVTHLFTLCGGHISPILVGAKAHGVEVVDVRDEANAVFAADAMARMTGICGVAAVTAGPGVTNTITAVKNAQMAESPVLIFGGATATLLKGRGSLQDIDQLSVMKPITKWATTVKTVHALAPTVAKALDVATSGVPGPVFVEVPVDLLYPEETVREWYFKEAGVEGAKGLGARALGLYLRGHLYRQFHAPHVGIDNWLDLSMSDLKLPGFGGDDVDDAVELLRGASQPVLIIGSQALVNTRTPEIVADAARRLGVPTFLGGMARGLLGKTSDIQFRHKRSKALKQADVVIIAGFPFDFRLGYGRSISSKARIISANLDGKALRKNRRPEVAVQAHPGEFLVDLADAMGGPPTGLESWFGALRDNEEGRDAEILSQSEPGDGLVNPLHLFQRLDDRLADDSVLVVDGGDFVATGSYILRPRSPLSWLDPGVFGTLGVGGGFALAAALARPGAQVWLIYGDGSSAYSLAEFDTFARHGLAPIAVIGTDASWAQIARDQVDLLGDDVGTVLERTPYHDVAAGYGGEGLLLTDPAEVDAKLDRAIELAASGRPVCLNVHIAQTDFRKGSISI
jgi:acetolactate synthase-1/2/3 large subunit